MNLPKNVASRVFSYRRNHFAMKDLPACLAFENAPLVGGTRRWARAQATISTGVHKHEH